MLLGIVSGVMRGKLGVCFLGDDENATKNMYL